MGRALEEDGSFQVVAVDKRERTVEIQTFDGDRLEMDFFYWFSLPLKRALGLGLGLAAQQQKRTKACTGSG